MVKNVPVESILWERTRARAGGGRRIRIFLVVGEEEKGRQLLADLLWLCVFFGPMLLTTMNSVNHRPGEFSEQFGDGALA